MNEQQAFENTITAFVLVPWLVYFMVQAYRYTRKDAPEMSWAHLGFIVTVTVLLGVSMQ